jgi:hypothetical protein
MTNKQIIKISLLATGFALVVALVSVLVRVRTRVASVRPFVAFMVEEVAPRKDQPPTSLTRLQTIAVRSDGSISRVSTMEVRLPIRFLYLREVIDATTKTRAGVEDYTRTVVKDKYDDIEVLKPGVVCDGTPAGQINGFTVVYSEEAVGPADEVQVIHKEWKAPQLGCYPLVQEWVGKAYGLAMDTKQTLASIKLGEPDPWYFSVPADYTARTTDEITELIKPLLRQ